MEVSGWRARDTTKQIPRAAPSLSACHWRSKNQENFQNWSLMVRRFAYTIGGTQRREMSLKQKPTQPITLFLSKILQPTRVFIALMIAVLVWLFPFVSLQP